MTVTLHYKRYFVPGTMKFDTVSEAVVYAWAMIEWNTAWPDLITNEDGTVALDHEALREMIRLQPSDQAR